MGYTPTFQIRLAISKIAWKMNYLALVLSLISGLGVIARASPSLSTARIWDEEILAAIRIDTPHPPVQARNLFHVSVAMYDAWAAYDQVAVGYLYRNKHSAADLSAARNEAISYAAYRLLTERYALSRSSTNTLPTLDARMAALGYDKNNITLNPATPAGLGNLVAATVSAYFIDDGALQLRTYQDLSPAQGGYAPINSPLIVGQSGTSAADVNRWEPLSITNGLDQHGFPITQVQKFLGSQWLGVRPFALRRDDPALPWIDPGPPPYLGGEGDAEFRTSVVEMIRHSSELTPDDDATVDISPASFGNNTLGANDGQGRSVNPFTGLPYAANVVKRGDFARVLAEFWADGPNSETPPGHWNVIANSVSDNPSFLKRIGGTGPVVDDLEWDIKVYFALNAAVHDAACAAWSLKRYYDGWRPIEAVRYMAQLGQSSDPNAPLYNPNGLPLVRNLIEVVTGETAKPGGRHAGLAVGQMAIFAWPGAPPDPITEHSGVHWMLGVNWLPYQKITFVTPAFPGYISGHSSFSRSAAAVLAEITGSPYFPGGLASYNISSLSFEKGPTQPVQLQWATYFDASDQAGISRIYGGIHPSVDDLTGRVTGAQCGREVWALVQTYFDGTVAQSPLALTIRSLDSGGCEVTYDTLRGFFYKLQSTPDLKQPFSDDSIEFVQAIDSSSVHLDNSSSLKKFYRLIRAFAP
jgi:hypothetical protein